MTDERSSASRLGARGLRCVSAASAGATVVQDGRVTTYGDLQSVMLYLDHGRDRWRWAVYDTTGVWDGALPELPAEAPFEEARAQLERFVLEQWGQAVGWPWVDDGSGWWSAGPVPRA